MKPSWEREKKSNEKQSTAFHTTAAKMPMRRAANKNTNTSLFPNSLWSPPPHLPHGGDLASCWPSRWDWGWNGCFYTRRLGTTSVIREYLIRSGRSKAVTCSHRRQEHSRRREGQEKGTGQTVFDLFKHSRGQCAWDGTDRGQRGRRWGQEWKARWERALEVTVKTSAFIFLWNGKGLQGF